MTTAATFRVLALAVAATMPALPAEARALGPVDVELAGIVGAATSPAGAVTPVGFELGARAGVSIHDVYVGGRLVYWFGGTTVASCVGPVFPACAASTSTATVVTSEHAFRVGAEVGYDVHPSPGFTLRPGLGIGSVSLHESSPDAIVVGETPESLTGAVSELYLEPVVTAMVSLGPVLLGADASMLWVPAHPSVEVALNGEMGMRF